MGLEDARLKDLADELSRRLATAPNAPGERREDVLATGQRAGPQGDPAGIVGHEDRGSRSAFVRDYVPHRPAGNQGHRRNRAPMTGDLVTTALLLLAVSVATFRLFAGV